MSQQPKPEQDKKGRFISGNIGGGRNKGSRNKLGEAFIDALYADFNANGEAAIEKVRAEKPEQYLKVIALILPKDLNVNVNNFESLSDDELRARIRQLGDIIGPFLGPEGDGGDSGGTEETTRH
ncbi:MAG: hypothetical protein GY933_07310 [Hyphomicrobiales bacterium]|nr:hypothetical protein [Hyphomicrobiales bacterium]